MRSIDIVGSIASLARLVEVMAAHPVGACFLVILLHWWFRGPPKTTAAVTGRKRPAAK